MKYKKDKGMAIIAVLTLVIILIVLTTALVAMSKEHLFTTSKHYEKSVAQNLAEAAIYEAILKLKTTSTWGDPPGPTEYLLMRAGNQDVTAIGAGGKSANSAVPYDIKGAYFITFDPGAGVPYSTNNLKGGGTVQGWKNRDVLAGQVDIIVNVAVGSVVKHLEVIANVPPGGNFYPVCGGKATFDWFAGNFTLKNAASGKDAFFHSNADGNSAIIGGDLGTVDFENNSKVKGYKNIIEPGPPATVLDDANFDSNAGTASIPNIDISDLPTDPGATLLPSGTYAFDDFTEKLKYRDDSGALVATYSPGDEIPSPGSGVRYVITLYLNPVFPPMVVSKVPISGWLPVQGGLEISKNVKVTGKGNLTLKSVGITFAGSDPPYLYLGGDTEVPEPNGTDFDTGNLKLVAGSSGYVGALQGAGSIYALGEVAVDPKEESMDPANSGVNGAISLYAEGDVTLNAVMSQVKYSGLLYTKGNFTSKVMEGPGPNNYAFELSGGSLIVGGDLKIEGIGGGIYMEIDDTILSSEPGGDIQTVFWQDF